MSVLTWVVETGTDEENIPRLLDSLHRSNTPVVTRKWMPFNEGPFEKLDIEGPVIFHGSLQGADWVRKHTAWAPGAVESHSALECRAYYPLLQERILNREHVFLPFGCLTAQKDLLLRALGEDDCIFIRPDSNRKLFTGQIVCKDTWDKDVSLLGWYDDVVLPSTMVVVARPQVVVHEWRFFVAQGQVVTGSRYRKNQKVVRELADPDMMAVAQNMATFALQRGFNPDPVWVLDLCSDSTGNVHILEVGSFSCAGLYAADTDLLVQTVNACW